MNLFKIKNKIIIFLIELLTAAAIILLILFIIFLSNGISFLLSYYNIHTNDKQAVFFVVLVVVLPLLYIIFLNRRMFFIKPDDEIFKITASFLKELNYSIDEQKKVLTKKFPKFKERKIQKLCNRINSKNFIPDKSFSVISKEKHKTRMYLTFILLEISGTDHLLSIKEEEIIIKYIRKLNIRKNIFESIKQSFVKKGLQEERKILEEQNRKKLLNQFSSFMLPYQAYRVLCVSPSVTKLQLKKAYRRLTKKYHPDKHIGKSDAEIQKIEEKFREIKEAYDLILKTKNL